MSWRGSLPSPARVFVDIETNRWHWVRRIEALVNGCDAIRKGRVHGKDLRRWRDHGGVGSSGVIRGVVEPVICGCYVGRRAR